ncbi:TetR family transcriptional regulator [Corynebacterium sp. 13CS0277]|uniref:TetR family transcriptional regulator n=1 Tax=Corynebacterium sp. 13CS0277 TaxID=2071994 RepID=UPI000D03F834|nr:TetR family transcriptional regulator [Corynebacterium sp. 13CS0277]PRQ11104.1 TetR family transcriptional regulator [Corynebacterium sp. 13CS0277]
MRPLTAEQVLLVADEVCRVFGCHVADYGRLAACAAATSAHFHGVAVWEHRSPTPGYLEDLVAALAPLSSHNDALGVALAQICTPSTSAREEDERSG